MSAPIVWVWTEADSGGEFSDAEARQPVGVFASVEGAKADVEAYHKRMTDETDPPIRWEASIDETAWFGWDGSEGQEDTHDSAHYLVMAHTLQP